MFRECAGLVNEGAEAVGQTRTFGSQVVGFADVGREVVEFGLIGLPEIDRLVLVFVVRYQCCGTVSTA